MRRLADCLIRLELAGASLAVLLLMTEERRLAPLALALIVLPWPLRLWRHGRLTVRTVLDWPLALFLLTAAVGVWAAYDRTLAWPKFWLIVGGVGLYYTLANTAMANRKSQIANANVGHWVLGIRYWVMGLCVFGAILSVYFVTQRDWVAEPTKFAAITRLGTWIAAHTPRVPGPYINGNVLGGALAVVLPLNLALVVTSRKSQVAGRKSQVAGRKSQVAGRKSQVTGSRITHHVSCITLSTCLLVSLSTLIMTGSRGAWLALGVAGGLWLLSRLRQRWARLADVLAVAAIAVALALLLWPGPAGGLSASRLADWLGSIPVGGTALNRFGLYRQSLTLVRDYPFTGSGLGCFMMVYSTYVLLLHVGFITHAHNLFLQIAVEQGLFGLLAFGWLVGAFFWSQVANRKSQIANRRLVLSGAEESQSSNIQSPISNIQYPISNIQSPIRNSATWAVVVILVHGLVDATLYSSRTLPFLFVPFGLVVANGRISKSANQQIRKSLTCPERSRIPNPHYALRITHYALPILLLAGALIWRGPLLGLVFSNLGTVHQTRTELSVYEWPEYPIQDAVRRQHRDSLAPAVAEFRRALAWDAGNVTANQRLGQLELAWGDYAAALAHLQTAWGGTNTQYPVPNTPSALRQLLGEALIVNGQPDAGRALWSMVRNDQGQLWLRASWYTIIGDEERAEWVRQASETG